MRPFLIPETIWTGAKIPMLYCCQNITKGEYTMIIPMHVSYRYTNYPDSKLATWFDKVCHSPSRFLFPILTCMICAYMISCFNTIPVSPTANEVITNVLVGVMVVSMLLTPFTGLLCRKLQLSRKLAAWDISRQFHGGKPGAKFWITLTAILLVLALPGIAALGVTTVENSKALDYHNTMKVLNTADAPAVTGERLVAYYEDENRFSRDVIPEALQAEAPEDVRYVVTLTEGQELAGIYEGTGVRGFKRYYEVSLVDRITEEVLATEYFYGSRPPYSIEDGTKTDQYGNWPDSDEITYWVRNLFGLA